MFKGVAETRYVDQNYRLGTAVMIRWIPVTMLTTYLDSAQEPSQQYLQVCISAYTCIACLRRILDIPALFYSSVKCTVAPKYPYNWYTSALHR